EKERGEFPWDPFTGNGVKAPDNNKGDEDCVRIRNSGLFNDDNCAVELRFMCRTELILEESEQLNFVLIGVSAGAYQFHRSSILYQKPERAKSRSDQRYLRHSN